MGEIGGAQEAQEASREVAYNEMAIFLDRAAAMYRDQRTPEDAAAEDDSLAAQLDAERISNEVDKLYDQYETIHMGDVGEPRLSRRGFVQLVDRYVITRAAWTIAELNKNSGSVPNFDYFVKQAEAVRDEMAAAFGSKPTTATEKSTGGIGRAEAVHETNFDGKALLPNDVVETLNDRVQEVEAATVLGGTAYLEDYRKIIVRCGDEPEMRG